MSDETCASVDTSVSDETWLSALNAACVPSESNTQQGVETSVATQTKAESRE